MRALTTAEGELGGQVRFKHIHFIDVLLELGIYGGLGGLAGSGSISASSLGGIGLVGLTGEERIVDLGHIHAVQGDVGGGGNDVLLVDTTKGDAVAGVGA